MTARILLVDDDIVARGIVAGLLRSSDFEVVECADGESAIRLGPETCPDLVLLDLGLPGLDGFDVCRRFRDMSSLAETPILVLTGRDDVDAIRLAFEAGASDFTVKSMSPALLVHRVRFMLRATSVVDELRRSEARLSEAQRVGRIGDWEVDMICGLMIGSAETYRLLGIGGAAGSRPLSRVLHLIEDSGGLNVGEFRDAMSRPTGRIDVELKIGSRGPGQRVVRLLGESEYGADGAVSRVLGTAQDLTEIAESREQIRMLAYYDALTGLPNRLLFVDQVRSALSSARRRQQRVALMMVDLDNFKQINDTLGHGAGDEVLRVVGARLRDAVREYDGLARDPAEISTVARMGGDEFLLSLTELESADQAVAIARRLLRAVSEPVHLDSGPLNVCASVGISIYPEDGDDFETLLKHADVALYQAKDAGRNTYEFYDQRMNEMALQRMMLETSLREAIGSGQLHVVVQPKVDGSSEAVIGGEALLRWRHPQHGAVAPAVFVALAERIGQAVPLTRFIIEAVCARMREWMEEGLDIVPIAINLSPHVFRDPDAVSSICEIPVRHAIDPSMIEYEVTETVLIDDPRRADAVLRQLRQGGYRVALDDFGTGFSSLSHLRNFSLDTLKIDRAFVRDLQDNPRDASIVRAIVELATGLGLSTVAEGVENELQRRALLALGCQAMQGYLFGKPQSLDAFTAMLRARRIADQTAP